MSDAEFVLQARLTLDLSQEAFAEALGMSRRQVIRWERGDSTLPAWRKEAIERLLEKGAS